MDYEKGGYVNKETIEDTQKRLQEFVDRYETHVNRALICQKRMHTASINLMIFILNHISVMPTGFEQLYQTYYQADEDYKLSLAVLFEDWRYLISDDV